MKTFSAILVVALATAFTLVRVQSSARADDKADAKVQANMAKLQPADRKLAEAQKWCPVQPENQLGEMGVPVKVMLKGEPVFLCCKGCLKTAKKNPDETLKKAQELKDKAASSK